MPLDPNDPFLESAIVNLIKQEIGALPMLVRQLQGAQASGIATIAFSASTQSATSTVSHGLGKTPTAVVATAYTSPSFGQIPTLNVHTFTSTTFNINGEIDSAYTGNISFCWIAR